MTGRERVLRTLEFRNPDRIPQDLWVLPAARTQYGEQLEALCRRYPQDIASLSSAFDHGFTPEYYQLGNYRDPWGSVWHNIQAGIIGEVKEPVFADYDGIQGYKAPIQQFLEEWQANLDTLRGQIEAKRAEERFIIGGWISLFERMQYLRGTEELYCDIAVEDENFFRLRDIIMEYMHAYLDCWLKMDVDAVAFGDDWGTQISLLISPDAWRKLFRPQYKELIQRIKAAGKKVFFHSDGCIFDLYQELIDLGVDAVNSQLWCMGVEKVAAQFAGKITFWGEISRQDILPTGTPKDVQAAADSMRANLFVNGGGLIGQSEINRDVPLENIEAALSAWNQ